MEPVGRLPLNSRFFKMTKEIAVFANKKHNNNSVMKILCCLHLLVRENITWHYITR